jgi:uncharacterized protein YcfJ
MNITSRISLAAAGLLAFATQAGAQVTFYEVEGFEGRSFTATRQVPAFDRYGFNDRASSVIVQGRDRWEVCDDEQFRGRCAVLRPGQYATLTDLGLNNRISSARIVNSNARVEDHRYAPAPVAPQITFYEHENFEGRSFPADANVDNFGRNGMNDRASSVVVAGAQWEVCEDSQFRGRCLVLRPGQYPSLAAYNLNDRISSARIVAGNSRYDESRYAPAPVANTDYRRRGSERLYEAEVTSVRAVLGTPEQRCWVEREQVSQDSSGGANVPGAIAGAIIGGILGHQVGGGRGKDLATAGGAVAGAAVGANVGRDSGQQTTTQDVKRCESVASQARPNYWDVTYNFRGQEHRIQMTTAPGATVTVNEQGEPRA